MLILASKSPRRSELLSLITKDFVTIPAVGEEKADRSLPAGEYVCELAKHKAIEVAASHPEDVVIGSDTIVVIDGEILGKPKDAKDAERMLKMLSGRVHSVFTGVCITKKNVNDMFFEETKVHFFELSEQQIADYIDSGEPFDKAGAYGIQDAGALIVSSISGDYYNVMGLPAGRLYREILEFCPEVLNR